MLYKILYLPFISVDFGNRGRDLLIFLQTYMKMEYVSIIAHSEELEGQY